MLPTQVPDPSRLGRGSGKRALPLRDQREMIRVAVERLETDLSSQGRGREGNALPLAAPHQPSPGKGGGAQRPRLLPCCQGDGNYSVSHVGVFCLPFFLSVFKFWS